MAKIAFMIGLTWLVFYPRVEACAGNPAETRLGQDVADIDGEPQHWATAIAML